MAEAPGVFAAELISVVLLEEGFEQVADRAA
jgi:hypothetical protein